MASKLTDLLSPDRNAIIALRKHHGWTGYGLYCALLHLLESQPDAAFDADYSLLSFHLREDEKVVESVVEDFDLFAFEEIEGVRRFFLPVMREALRRKAEISKRRAEAAAKRWHTNASVKTSTPAGSVPKSAAASTQIAAPTPMAPPVSAPAQQSDAPAIRPGEEASFDIFRNINAFREKRDWLEFLCKEHRCSLRVLHQLYELFLKHLKNIGAGRYRSLQDAQAHFANWLKKKYARELKAELIRSEEKRLADEEYERHRAVSVTHDEYLASKAAFPSAS